MSGQHPPSLRRQQGATLVVGLIFLAVLTLIGVTAARVAGLEERMAGNLRDRAVALQAAEMALRDAERDIMLTGAPGTARPRALSQMTFATDCGAAGAANERGLCDRRLSPTDYTASEIVWPAFAVQGVNTAALTLDMTAAPSVVYGTFTGATAIVGLTVQPRYVMERFEKNVGGTKYYYRITARAQGINANTVVWLQEIFESNL
jgi:type IV pilus assembly protein PilX